MIAAVAAIAVALAAADPPAVSVDERLGGQVPLDLPFRDTTGATVTLGDHVGGDLPVLLVLAYARCEMLCNVVLRGVVEAVRALPARPGRDYRLLLVGLDPRETVDEAIRKQAVLLGDAGLAPTDRSAWPYLLEQPGDGAAARLADALGFRYEWDPATRQYAHPAVVFVLTPDGRISRYLYGVRFALDELRLALADAAAGVLGTPTAETVLRCFRFDPAHDARRARIQRVIQAGALTVFLGLAAILVGLFAADRRRHRRPR